MRRKAAFFACLGLIACSEEAKQQENGWGPGITYATPEGPTVRGLLDRRGLIHAHSVYSHDACDGEPVKDGKRDEVCFDDFRRGLCQAKHDFVMLTDHRESFSDTEFPETLLYRPDRGDKLVERNGTPVASWAACPDGGRPALIMAGAEAGTMPVGLETHAGEPGVRGGVYGDQTPEAIETLKEHGAVVLVSHTESWSDEGLMELPLDGFEMFNLHANLFANLGSALEFALSLSEGEIENMPHPDLVGLPFLGEDPVYLDRWSRVLASGTKRVTTMGTDCHRNTFQVALEDGERVDSYRRMMIWFSNHLLIRPNPDGTWDDSHLKEALRARRLYGVFESLGFPLGFDFRAEAGGEVFEMGDELDFSSSPTLIVERPTLQNRDRAKSPPVLTLRLLRATAEGWVEVAAGPNRLEVPLTEPGAYRAEVRMIPVHLEDQLGKFRRTILEEGRVWIYSNAIFVR